jgi:5-methylcytosine-specific restriction endonuclease McrBC regulatory subunit McrC
LIELVEYTRSAVPLGQSDLTYLLRFAKGGGAATQGIFQSIMPTQEPGLYEITPGAYVGRLGLPSGEVLGFSSRFSFEDVLKLISSSGRLPAHLSALESEMETGPSLVDVIAAAFLREVASIVGSGIGKGYIERRFLEPPYPGRLDVSYHLGHLYAREDRLATKAKRLTPDIPINQALAAGLDVLARVPLSTPLRIQGARMAGVFRSVRRTPQTAAKVRRIHLPNLHIRYRRALALAALILEGASIAPHGEGLAGASVLYSMPKVWESCVAGWAERKWGPEFSVETGYLFNLSNGGELRSEADVVVRKEGEIVALYDAKYKRPGKTPDVPDVYQMVAYCERLNLAGATLVYPERTERGLLSVGDHQIATLGLAQIVDESGELQLVG